MSGAVTGRKGTQSGSGTTSFDRSGTRDRSLTEEQRRLREAAGRTTERVLTPEGYRDVYREARPGAGGLTPDQQAAAGYFRGRLGADPGRQGFAENYFRQMAVRPSLTLESIRRDYPELYGERPTIQAGQVGGVRDVATETAASRMDAYRNPFEQQVVEATLSDLGQARDEALNRAGMQQAAAGAFGGGRQALREAAIQDDYLKNVGRLAGALRQQGFMQGAQLGAGDASRALQSGTANQRADLQRALTQAQLDQQAGITGAQLLSGRQQFDVAAAERGDRRRDQAAQRQADIALRQAREGDVAAQTLFGVGGAGQKQILDYLRAGVPLFGGQQDTTETTSDLMNRLLGEQILTTDVGTGTSTERGRTSSKGGALGGI
tara:strand:+ start:925 stop:2058 length:1134 start_codon:yes stop_codon:yes gene_type:complete